MEEKHRKRIKDNIDRLIKRTDFDELSYACHNIGLLSQVMLQNVHRIEFLDDGPWTDERLQNERHKRLFQKITKRGPDAYDMLRRIFADLKYDSALQILIENDSYVSIHNNKTVQTMGGTNMSAAQVVDRDTPPDEGGSALNNNERRSSSFSNSGEDNRDNVSQKNDRRLSSKSSSGEIVLEEYDGEIRPDFVVKKSKMIQKHPSLDTYSMQSKEHRGVFFMVNMIDFVSEDRRDGAEEDASHLLRLFKELGFKLFSYKNLSQDEFFKILDELLKSDYTKNCECFVMALMSHGNMDEYVQRISFSDGSVVKIKEIEKYFQHHVCENLVNKPKIFIFPFCRGDISESGVLRNRVQTDTIKYNNDRANNIPLLSDLIECYATAEGFKSHRDVEDGSWYIQSFVRNMADNAHDTSFEDIIKKIQAETSKLRTDNGLLQTANFVNKGFNKVLYFNPGTWLE